VSLASILPDNPHDAARLALVRPPGYVNPEPADVYNLVVLGAGSAGLITSLVAASLGARVALVERELMGGDCLNVGCVPSKGVIRASRIMADVREAERLGLPLPPDAQLDFAKAMDGMRRKRARIAAEDSVARYSKEFGVEVFLGRARFRARDSVLVERDDGHPLELRFRKAVIATGARAVVPPIRGLREAGFRTNETIFNLTERPRRLAVIGGGPIGCELAQAFQRLGCDVVIFEQGRQFLQREDPDAAMLLAEVFRREGIRVELGAEVLEVKASGDSRFLRYRDGEGAERDVQVDEILVGAGRQPNVEDLGLESVGVAYDPLRGVRVDDHLRTTNRRIFAAGDVCMAWKFTHAADAAAKIVVQNALFFGRKRLSSLVMPWCTYTSPEIAHVGLYAREAAERGLAIDTYLVPLHEVNRAVTDGEDEGFVKIHTRKGTDRVLGATIVASHAGDLLSQVTQLMVARVGLGTLTNVIFPYPTQADALKRAAGRYTRTRLSPWIAALFRRYLALLR
jgi:pyruvate/2-oxoglutarate dehydrogenase complex dihydrolipoamide dehydrogenase (E3) component